jgi:hypothetical protein
VRDREVEQEQARGRIREQVVVFCREVRSESMTVSSLARNQA